MDLEEFPDKKEKKPRKPRTKKIVEEQNPMDENQILNNVEEILLNVCKIAQINLGSFLS